MAMKLVTDTVRGRFPKVANISTDKLCELLKTNCSERKVVLLDVRDEKEYQVSHLHGALHVSPSTNDMEEVIKLISEAAGSSTAEPKKVVCYCSVGYRSSSLAQQLSDELIKHENQAMKSIIELYNLEGSIFKWANEGKDIVDNQGNKTVLVHPYSFVWGKLLNHELRSSEPSAPCKKQEES